MATQSLRGFVGQQMSGQRPALSPQSFVYPSNSSTAAAYTFTAPKAGWFRFIMWGGGGGYQSAVGSGAALVVAERPLAKGQTVALSVGSGDYVLGNGFDTTATFPWGEVLTAGAGKEAATSTSGGVAVGNVGKGDILVNGAASAAPAPGAGASYTSALLGTLTGGPAGDVGSPIGGVPGGGVRISGAPVQGGNGVIMVHQVRMRL